jgi:hypothetical protein
MAGRFDGLPDGESGLPRVVPSMLPSAPECSRVLPSAADPVWVENGNDLCL